MLVATEKIICEKCQQEYAQTLTSVELSDGRTIQRWYCDPCWDQAMEITKQMTYVVGLVVERLDNAEE